MYGVYLTGLIYYQKKTMKKMRKNRKTATTSSIVWYTVCCLQDAEAQTHSCARHCLLHFIQVPFSFCSPVSRRTPRAYTVWVSSQIVSSECQSLALWLSASLALQRRSNRIWTRLFLITATPCNVNPVRKRPPSVGRSQIQELTD